MKKNYTICLYGASSEEIASIYISKGEELGRQIASRGHRMIFGGGSTGLMGACARGMSQKGGTIISIIPDFMKDYEGLYEDATRIIYTQSMDRRKEVMEANADAFIIAPGGIGTLDEFFQVLTLISLDRKISPIVIFNVNGYYDKLIDVIETGIKEGFIRDSIRHLFYVTDDANEALNYIELATD